MQNLITTVNAVTDNSDGGGGEGRGALGMGEGEAGNTAIPFTISYNCFFLRKLLSSS